MADLFSSGICNRDIQDKALVALKKGTQLLKYGRKGNPKCCPFRLSSDESSLIWLSSGKEKELKLASVSKIISGQRTAVFQRFLRPEKDHVSFSLIYKNGKRSLDLICKDKFEAEVWFAGLKALIASGQSGRSKIDGWNDGGIYFEVRDQIHQAGYYVDVDTTDRKIQKRGLTEKFKEKDTIYSGSTTFIYESFMQTVLLFLVA